MTGLFRDIGPPWIGSWRRTRKAAQSFSSRLRMIGESVGAFGPFDAAPYVPQVFIRHGIL